MREKEGRSDGEKAMTIREEDKGLKMVVAAPVDLERWTAADPLRRVFVKYAISDLIHPTLPSP